MVSRLMISGGAFQASITPSIALRAKWLTAGRKGWAGGIASHVSQSITCSAAGQDPADPQEVLCGEEDQIGAADGDGYLCRDVHVFERSVGSPQPAKGHCSDDESQQHRAHSGGEEEQAHVPRTVAHAVEGVIEYGEQHLAVERRSMMMMRRSIEEELQQL
jgi:hypothetical protein